MAVKLREATVLSQVVKVGEYLGGLPGLARNWGAAGTLLLSLKQFSSYPAVWRHGRGWRVPLKYQIKQLNACSGLPAPIGPPHPSL